MPLDSTTKTKYLKRSHGLPRSLSNTYAEILGLVRRNCDKSNPPPTAARANHVRARMAILWRRCRRNAIFAAQTDQSSKRQELEKSVDVSHARSEPRRQRNGSA